MYASAFATPLRLVYGTCNDAIVTGVPDFLRDHQWLCDSMKRKWYKHSFVIGLLTVGVAFVLFIVIEVGAYFTNVLLPWHRQSAIEATLLWGGLSELPSTSTKISIATSGSMFTRTFDLKFYAPAADIQRWIVESPRLSGAISQNLMGHVRRYEIVPGEKGAGGGWVEVRDGGRKVVIHMSWS